ncbi:hypothetical protein IAR50_004938 [Cryptococcus sp. DSM 104548]
MRQPCSQCELTEVQSDIYNFYTSRILLSLPYKYVGAFPHPTILSPRPHPNPTERPDIQDQENERQREEAEVRATKKSRGSDARLTLPAKQNHAGASGSGDKAGDKRGDKDGKWIQGIDYAYEYVPVTQKRQGRNNM